MAEISETALATAFAKALEMHESATKVREIKASTVSPLNPSGKEKPKLRCETIFCGVEQKTEQLLPVEIDLFNRLQAGRYNGGKWTVHVREDDMGRQQLEVRVPVNDLNALMDLPNSLVGILSQIVAEAESRAKATK